LRLELAGPATLAAALLSAPLATPPPAAAAEPPSIVLVSIDTLRSDRLPAYGYRGVETPAIDALARDGVLYEHAFSHVPLTLPSHLSMLSGLLPAEHGVRDNLGYRFDAAAHPWAPRLLQQAGYATAAFVSAFVLREETGFAAGFEKFDAELEPGTTDDPGQVQRPGRETVARAKQWLGANAARRFFLLVHLYEPHSPYEPQEPFRSKYKDAYDGEVATADALVGELVAELRRLGVYDRSLILLLSDHGEGLGDHGESEHGLLLYREAIQVPLIAKLPGSRRAGERLAAPAQLVDVAPSLLAAAGVEVPPEMKGTPLQELGGAAGPARRILSETVYPRLHYGWSDLVSVVEFPFHLIHGPDPELYRLDRDPRETDNVRAQERRAFHDLRAAAEAAATPVAEPSVEDPETAAKLAALGYLGGRAKVTGPLADPKQKLPVLHEYRQALARLAAGEPAGTIPTFRRMVTESPGMTEAWIALGSAYRFAGQPEEALAAFQRALEQSPGSEGAARGATAALADLGRWDDARRHAELLVAVSPAASREMLCFLELQRRDFVAAEREARKALELGGERLKILVLLARALNGQQRPQEAIDALARAERRIALMSPGRRDYEGLYLALGDAYMTLGNPREAYSAYQKEIDVSPGNPLGYVSLAILFQTLGRTREAVSVLRTLVDRNTANPGAYRAAALTFQKLGVAAEGRRVLAEGLRRFPDDAPLRAIESGKQVSIAIERMP